MCVVKLLFDILGEMRGEGLRGRSLRLMDVDGFFELFWRQ